MNRRQFTPALLATLLLVGSTSAPLSAGTFVWTGLGSDQDVATGGNWQGGNPPLFDGTDDIILGKAINNTVAVNSDTFVNSISLTSGDDYFLQGAGIVLRINNNAGNGIYGSVGSNGNRLFFDQGIAISANGTGNLRMDAGDSSLVIQGGIIDDPLGGVTTVYLSNNNGGTMGAFIFNNTGAGSTYSGNTYITGIAGTPVVVAFWNSQPFGNGTGTLFIQNSTELIAHGPQRVDNDIVFNTTLANDPIYLKSWDATLCFDGDVTLANNTTLVAQRASPGAPSADNTGVYPLPGPQTRYVIDFEDDIVESGGARTLTVNGPGIILIEGNNSYTGGTVVGSGGASGSLIFGSLSSVPASGLITVNSSGYAGLADSGAFVTPGNFASFLTQVDQATSTGAVGIDTLPGNGTITLSDNIDLSTFSNPISLGTATSAILTGTITPQGANYRFGNGGGTLYVQSSLTGGRGVIAINNSIVPLTLYLQASSTYSTPTSNTYTGVTTANNGFIIFDGDSALPGGANSLVASSAGNSYIGYTDVAGIGGVTLGSANAFLALFNTGTTHGIIGFDTHAGNGTVNVTDNIDLSPTGLNFQNGVYLGTTTSAELSGTLTPTADNILRLTAAQGGTLQVDNITDDIAGSVALSLGTTSPNDIYSSGTIYLPNANTYTGGTTINSTAGGITLEVGDSNSLGTGALTLVPGAIAGLQSTSSCVNLPNNIVFGASSTLYITGNNDLQLSGNLSGPGSLSAINPEDDPNLTLSGNNSAFSGDISLYNFTLVIDSNTAAGTGTLRFLNSGSEVDFSANALNPVIYGLNGDVGYITLYNANALTIDMSNPLNGSEFGGTIDDGGSGGSITITSSVSADALYLHGHNTYSGGTFIGTGSSDKAALAIGTDDALGTGPVTLNTSLNGAFAVNAGVTFTNDFVYTGGTLQGFGTFQPASVNSVAGGPIIFDTGKAVVPGIFGLGTHGVPGQLTLATGADFANGGAFLWSLQDVTRPDGHSTLIVDGTNNLNISATGGGFTIYLATLDATGAPGAANLTAGTPYTFTIATTTGGGMVTNFNAADFTIDSSLFMNGALTNVSITADSTDLFINFTPVPEPSTYALLGLGLSAVVLPVLRRRKRA
jgi:hypothetical protein